VQVGDIVKYFLTDQLGVVLDINPLGAIAAFDGLE